MILVTIAIVNSLFTGAAAEKTFPFPMNPVVICVDRTVKTRNAAKVRFAPRRFAALSGMN